MIVRTSEPLLSKVIFAVVCGLIVFLFWIGASSGSMGFEPLPLKDNRFGLLAEGFLQGQLHLPVAPPRELLDLRNPYAPAARANANATFYWDSLLFNGKYYLYWGTGPILTMYIPWRLITGNYPADALAIMLFSLGAVAMMLLIYRELRPKNISLLEQSFALALFAFASTISLTLPHGYVVFTAAGLFYSMAGIFFTLRSVSHPGKWYLPLLAGLALGLAAMSRFTNVAYVGMASLVFVAHNFKNNRTQLVQKLTLFLTPIVAAIVFIGLYNYLRFGSATEFGIIYQLGMVDHTDLPFNSTAAPYFKERLLKHIWLDLFSPLSFSSSFPFVYFGQSSEPPFKLPGLTPFAYDFINGLFVTAPIITMGLLLSPLYVIRAVRNETHSYFFQMIVPASLAVGGFLVTCWYTSQRYLLDIQPYWLLGSFFVILQVRKSIQSQNVRRTFDLVFAAAAAFSIFVGIIGCLHGPYSQALDAQHPWQSFWALLSKI
jgi:hypothetical protein